MVIIYLSNNFDKLNYKLSPCRYIYAYHAIGMYEHILIFNYITYSVFYLYNTIDN